MKKVLILLACAAAIVACSKEEPIAINQGQAISFSSPFINKATRAVEVTTADLLKFNVWGTVTDTSDAEVLIFNGTSIEKSGDVWVCENANEVQYWVAGANYKFTAIKNHTSVTPASGMPTAINADVDPATGAMDLILAQTPITGASATQPAVPLTFSHLMSKVAFTVTSDTTLTDDYKYVVSGITVANFENGTFTLGTTPANGTWAGGDPQDISFGEITVDKDNNPKSNGSLLIIPNTASFNVSFTVDFMKGSKVLKTNNYTKNITTPLVAGHSYNFKIGLSAVNPIQFTATVEPWPAKGDTDYHDVTVQ